MSNIVRWKRPIRLQIRSMYVVIRRRLAEFASVNIWVWWIAVIVWTMLKTWWCTPICCDLTEMLWKCPNWRARLSFASDAKLPIRSITSSSVGSSARPSVDRRCKLVLKVLRCYQPHLESLYWLFFLLSRSLIYTIVPWQSAPWILSGNLIKQKIN